MNGDAQEVSSSTTPHDTEMDEGEINAFGMNVFHLQNQLIRPRCNHSLRTQL